MPELLKEIPRWVVELGLILAVGLFILQLLLKLLPVVRNHGIKGRLMKAEAQIAGMTVQIEASREVGEKMEAFLREKIEYYRVDYEDSSSSQE